MAARFTKIVVIVFTVISMNMNPPQSSGNNQSGVGTTPAVVPAPRSVVVNPGRLSLGFRIVTKRAELQPLAGVLAGEFKLLTGRTFLVTDATIQLGDILLEIDPELQGESYLLEVNNTAAIVRGGNYGAVALGTVTLLQSLVIKENNLELPCIRVNDAPFAQYRGLMIDLARKWHEIETIKQAIVLCRWYKIRYLHLHFTDDQSFTFPSTAYPNLPMKGRHYTLAQLQDLEVFAHERNVTLIPEMDMPSHFGAALGAMPELDCEPASGLTLCPGREETYGILDTLIGEFCKVFQSTPYFHIGADEVNKTAWAGCTHCQGYMKAHGIENTEELYRHFIVRMNNVVKKHSKKTLVWEGFGRDGTIEIPRDITVMVFECLYNLPTDLIADGYPVINTSWKPLYVVNQRNWSPEYIYGWNMYRWENWYNKSQAYPDPINVAPTFQVFGSQICAWEQDGALEIPSLRKRLASMSERIWNPEAQGGFKDFAIRLNKTDALLTKLLGGFSVQKAKSNIDINSTLAFPID